MSLEDKLRESAERARKAQSDVDRLMGADDAEKYDGPRLVSGEEIVEWMQTAMASGPWEREDLLAFVDWCQRVTLDATLLRLFEKGLVQVGWENGEPTFQDKCDAE